MTGTRAHTARQLTQHTQRLAWLTAHPGLLTILPGEGDAVGPVQEEALDVALRGMTHERLFATNARGDRVRWAIRALVSELRGEHTTGADPHLRPD